MSDVVERAKGALEGVTEGPWTFQHWGGQNQNGDYAESILFDGAGESMTYGLPDHDGEFIAASRTLIPELVAEVERTRERERKLRDLCTAAPHLRDPWEDDWEGAQVVSVNEILAILSEEEA
ncbi:hypothetical protein SEA_EJIMIX_72 [Mycobacterium phage Ejimix]|uniref:hypothetical protein n=1 Tax=Mycobacterium phage Redno2 TaxID=1340709 RepID=UPI000387A5D9|nr:hypothetical protein N860_gp069 [Mycobacterium phage Redno2]AWH13885.1 hypothetical protein SEA_HALLEY_74 [Mycobacterium phage Halley]AXQ52075.1 hypothetical protein SEA_EJIMIX_72 [Mycobacterium phage Ejimix]AXQ62477.1 hypothetical protein SEA_ZELINK_70 [Mycobacterium phage Zelink]QBI99709.1 hypothetical protein SEA_THREERNGTARJAY_70 [Mycobacterium phage ThreeRngTarjay]QDP43817.1 hypothetical protein SEA_DALLAS_71 [Mycobacterium phage Dallas]QXO12883.1 hypothetical protein SEA_LATRETIUM_83